MKKLFVGNFSFNVSEDSLKDYFAQIGDVASVKIITEGPGGRSRGFGFVEMSNPDDADRAIEELDGQEWEGRPVRVSEAKPKRD